MILPIYEGFFCARTIYGQVYIGDTSLRNYMPKYIKTMRNRNNITCVCKTFISSILLQSCINKWRISQLDKLGDLYLYRLDFYKYPRIVLLNTRIKYFQNNSHINLRACGAESSYHCTSPNNGSTIPKWGFVLNCCYDCTKMNALYLELSEQLDRLFPASLHKIKFHIFQNIAKSSIHGLRPLKYKNMC